MYAVKLVKAKFGWKAVIVQPSTNKKVATPILQNTNLFNAQIYR